MMCRFGSRSPALRWLEGHVGFAGGAQVAMCARSGLILPGDHLIVGLPSLQPQVTLIDWRTSTLPLIA
jgi:hypothetical protein